MGPGLRRIAALAAGIALVLGNAALPATLAAIAVLVVILVLAKDWRDALVCGCLAGLGIGLGAMWQMGSVYPAGGLDLAPREWGGLAAALAASTIAASVVGVPEPRWKRALVALLLVAPVTWLAGSGVANHYRAVKRTSVYVTMRDGVRIATDIYLPRGLPVETRLPTVLSTSRYLRYTRYHFPFSLILGGPQGSTRRRYIESGYALVTIDARGTGASFGIRNREFDGPERADGPEIVDWIVRQPWSNGRVGSEGISYGGTAAEFLAVSGHPAVKAVSLNFALYDTYLDILSPGGIRNEGFVRQWARMNRMLDTGVLDPEIAPVLARLAWGGAMPVDADRDHVLLNQALALRARNYDIEQSRQGRRYRDEVEDPSVRGSVVSPYMYQAAARAAGVPMLMITGWLDGGYQHAAIKRWLTVPNTGSRLVIGPWDHGAFSAISPCGEDSAAASRRDWWKDRLSFFDYHLRGIDRGEKQEPRIKYYQMCGAGWRQSATWPVPGTSSTLLYLQADRTLGPVPPKMPGALRYRADPAATSGPGSRWMSLAQNLLDPFPIGYPDRAEQGRRNLVLEGAPLPSAVDVTGHPELEVTLAVDQREALLFVYLEDVAPDGSVTYVTEGLLNLTSRQPTNAPLYRDVVVQRSFKREDARAMQPGVAEAVTVPLLPTSFRFRPGHRIRLSLAGADRGNFQPVDGPLPTYRLVLSPEAPARLVLPTEAPSE